MLSAKRCVSNKHAATWISFFFSYSVHVQSSKGSQHHHCQLPVTAGHPVKVRYLTTQTLFLLFPPFISVFIYLSSSKSTVCGALLSFQPLLHSFLCAAAPPIVFPQISSTLLLPSVDNVNNPTFNNTLSDSVSALHLCPCGNSTLDWVFHRASQLGCQREACRGGRTQPGSFPTRHGFTLPEGASENLTV